MTASISNSSILIESLKTHGFMEAEAISFQEFIGSKIASGITSGVFKKKDTGLKRTVVMLSKDEIYILLNSRSNGDKALGSGAVKTLKMAFNVITCQKVATYSISSSEDSMRENALKEALGTNPGLQLAPFARVDYSTSEGPKTRVFEPLYDADLASVVKETDASKDVLTTGDKIKVTSRLASGLLQMQTKGLVHRDIKPENILCKFDASTGFYADLSDFGLSCHIDDKDMQLIMQGSPKYFSPEYIEYASKPLEMPREYLEADEAVKAKEKEILAVIDPEKKAKGYSEYLYSKFIKANPDSKEAAEALKAELCELREARASFKPRKDFSNVTTFAHDNYALGLTFYALFTSAKALDEFLTTRDSHPDILPTFDGYDVPENIQLILTGLLKANPAERMRIEEVLSLI